MYLISVLDGLNSDFCAGHENPDIVQMKSKLYTYFIAYLGYVLLQIPGKFQILLNLCQLANSKL